MKSSPRNNTILVTVIVLLTITVVLLVSLINKDTPTATMNERAENAVQTVADTTERPPASPAGLAAADKNGDGVVFQSGMHPWIVEDEPGTCPICGMDLMPVRVDGMEEGTVRIDPVTMQNIGVRTAPVTIAPLRRTVRTTGRFEVNEQATTIVSPKIGGWIETLYVNYEGARVRKGDRLFEVYSPDLVSTQEEYLLALRNAQRLAGTTGAADAQRLMEAARRRLSFWDITDTQIEALVQTGTPQKTLTFFAPATGTLTRTAVTVGQRVMAGQDVMQLTNLSQLWLMVDVFEQDLHWVKLGTEATIQLPYATGSTMTGRVEYIYDALDPALRAVKARIVVPNASNVLKPGMYATVELSGHETGLHPVVPSEAVITTGKRSVVILALGDGRFQPVEIDMGIEADGQTQILRGLVGDEQVVTSAQFLIDSEARLASAVSAMMGGHNHGATPAATTDEVPTPTIDHAAMIQDTSPTALSSTASDAAVQVVKVDIMGAAFTPDHIDLQAGIPAQLIFTRHTDQTCATDVMIPALGIEKTPLPLHESVTIAFTPTELGSFTFACGMDMVKGTLLVTSSR